MSDVLTISAGPLSAGVAPAAGGALSHFRRDDGFDLFRAATPEVIANRDPMGVASFPLVPFSGRIERGKLTFLGRTHQLAINLPPEKNAIHGDGWQNPWQVEHADATSVRLALPNPGRGWPWAYTAHQTYSLAPDALTVEMSITNESDDPMPAGLGVHPWYDWTPDATLQFNATDVFNVNEEYLHTGATPIPARWDFSEARRVEGTDLANCFAGWDGRAVVAWPDRGVSITIEAGPPFGHLVVYTPPGQNFFCVEPVSNTTDAFNLHERGEETPPTGTVTVAPGDTMRAAARFVVGG